MPSHLRNGKDLSIKEQQRAICALKTQRGCKNVPIIYELSQAAVERTKRINEHPVNRPDARLPGGAIPPISVHVGNRGLVQGQPNGTSQSESSPFVGQIPREFQTSRIEPLNPCSCSDRTRDSTEQLISFTERPSKLTLCEHPTCRRKFGGGESCHGDTRQPMELIPEGLIGQKRPVDESRAHASIPQPACLVTTSRQEGEDETLSPLEHQGRARQVGGQDAIPAPELSYGD
jgi:hypothetical protein